MAIVKGAGLLMRAIVEVIIFSHPFNFSRLGSTDALIILPSDSFQHVGGR